MTAQRSAISVLRFGAGDLALAIAAEDVVTVAFARAGVPHIGEVLGIESGARTSGQRAIHVRAPGIDAGGEAVFLADPPVEVLPCHIGNILPMAPGISRVQWQPVMGFARIDDQMLLLLDIPGIVQALRERKEREER